MQSKSSLEEIISNRTGGAPDSYIEALQPPKMYKDAPLEIYLLKHFKFRELAKYWDLPDFYHKTLVNDLQLTSSLFLNRLGAVHSVPEIPRADVDDADNLEPKLKQIFDEFPFFKFGGVPFVCTHDYLWGIYPGLHGHDKDMFEIRYGIKLSDVYISLNELQSVASFNSIFSIIDDFIITGNHDDTVLTIIDNDLPYGAKNSFEKHECHFKPIFCIDQGVPVKYIKIVNDNDKILYSHQYVSEQRHQYAEQRKCSDSPRKHQKDKYRL